MNLVVALIALLDAAGIALLLNGAHVVAAVLAIAMALLVFLLAQRAVPGEERRGVGLILSVAFGARLFVLGVVHEILVAVGRGGNYLDDYTYADLSARLAQYLHGQPAAIQWVGERYLFGGFVYVETGLFYVFGPDVTIPKVLIATLGCLLSLVTFLIARELWGPSTARVALVATAFFPSLLLWSVLNLKDIPTALLAALAIWGALRFVRSPTSTVRYLLVVALALTALEDVRRFLFEVLGLLIPLSFLFAPALPPWRRLCASAALAAVVAVVGAATGGVALGAAGSSTIDYIEAQRAFRTIGARTAFADPAAETYEVTPGQRFVILELGSPADSTSGSDRPSIPVTPGQIIVLDRDAPDGPGILGTVKVRPGTLIVITGTAPDPSGIRPLVLRPGTENAVRLELALGGQSATTAVQRLASYLPKGVLYAMAAPFPWSAETPGERVAAPEMVTWYLAGIAAIATTWRSRRRWRDLFLIVAYVGAMIGVLALVEGNIGTLYRHRAMIEPFVFVLAAPAVADLAGLGSRLRRRVPG